MFLKSVKAERIRARPAGWAVSHGRSGVPADTACAGSQSESGVSSSTSKSSRFSIARPRSKLRMGYTKKQPRTQGGKMLSGQISLCCFSCSKKCKTPLPFVLALSSSVLSTARTGQVLQLTAPRPVAAGKQVSVEARFWSRLCPVSSPLLSTRSPTFSDFSTKPTARLCCLGFHLHHHRNRLSWQLWTPPY